MASLVFNTLFNLQRYIAFEQRDPHRVQQMHAHPGLRSAFHVLIADAVSDLHLRALLSAVPLILWPFL